MKAKEFAEFVRMWNGGCTVAAICQRFDLTPSAVYTTTSRNREVCNRRRGGCAPDPKLVRRVGMARRSGASIKDIAEAYHVCTSTVARYVKRYEDMPRA